MGRVQTQVWADILWNWNSGLVQPNWQWFANHADVIIVPGAVAGRSINLVNNSPVSRFPDTVDGSPTVGTSFYGRTIRADGGERYRYTLPDGGSGFFSKDLRWSAGAIMQINDVSVDEQTIFAQSGDDDTAGARRFFLEISKGGALEARNGAGLIVGSSNFISDNEWFYAIASCDGAETIALYLCQIETARLAVNGITGSMTADLTSDDELHLLSHFTAANDDLDGDLALFWKLRDYTITEANVLQILVSPIMSLQVCVLFSVSVSGS